MSLGPVDVVIIAFEGNQFRGEIAPAIREAVEQGTIRIVDLAFLIKDEQGAVEAFELSDFRDASVAEIGQLAAETGGLLSEDDVRQAADSLDPNSSALMLVFEHAWAAKLQQAIVNANGRLVAQVRIPREVVENVSGAHDRRAEGRQ